MRLLAGSKAVKILEEAAEVGEEAAGLEEILTEEEAGLNEASAEEEASLAGS